MKKAQFFVISLVLILISMVSIYTYVRSADAASVFSLEKNSMLDLINIIDAVKMRNERYLAQTPPWWNSAWAYRELITITTAVDNPPETRTIEFNPQVPTTKLITSSCSQELRLTNTVASPTELESNVSAAALPCNITRTEVLDCGAPGCTATLRYYVYYGNSGAQTPSYRNTVQGTETGATLGTEEKETALCDHFESIYPKTGAAIACDITGYVGNKTNVTVYYSSTNLKFNGTII